MLSHRVHFIASRFSDFQGFKVRPYTHQLLVVTADGKRTLFFEEVDFWKYTGDLMSNIIKRRNKNANV